MDNLVKGTMTCLIGAARTFFLAILALAVCLLLVPSSSMGGTVIKLATLEWEPYIGTQLQGGGYVAQLVRLAFAGSEYEVELSFLPWARTVHMAKGGDYEGYLPEYYSEEIAKDFLFSDPFPGGTLVFFKRKKEEIDFSTFYDLKPYTIGVVRGYVNNTDFDEAAFLTKEEANDDLQNLRKLLGDRIDLVVADKHVALHLLKKYLPGRMEEVEYLEKPIEEKQLYFCISKQSPNAGAILTSFNKGLEKMRQNGSLLRLIENPLLQY